MSPKQSKQAKVASKPQSNHGQIRIEVNKLPLVLDDDCKVLILGIFPGEESQKDGFYYCDSRNRFWKVLEKLFNDWVPKCFCGRREYLLMHHIALWDVGACAKIKTIKTGNRKKNEVEVLRPNAVCCLLKMMGEKNKDIAVFCNGRDAKSEYDKHIKPIVGIDAVELPSTSGVNANYRIDTLVKKWQIVADYINGKPVSSINIASAATTKALDCNP